MKRLAPYALMLLTICYSTGVFSQNPGNSKPKQFDNYPAVISCTVAELIKAFGTTAGQSINFSFSDNFNFSGNVISNVVKYSNLQTALIKSPNFNNSIFSISKRVNADNSITYTGRIINMDYFDGYELKQDANADYKLLKIETDKVIPVCK